ncbi:MULTISPECIES: ShlB/FhaC/HecB family hemolysin secretion/activation protein [Pseudanabaena]|uniref:ShlB/FhaC/HecB family hemolysin secretion/activation protein n=1 Tax=Pseudanabaena catenata USMAC16 TaxID=1855837 RepID=A0A9X4RHI5_9CYAN|nr:MULTISPECIES: ShlB/FhaC/HecB family hemolysin secretion/activation protein [Pseudanabaena]MDG3494427.1 ShlB/FhaC/HecB family hemolysin secretion/activation protein [Pseudanabaena catenata USMAC16]
MKALYDYISILLGKKTYISVLVISLNFYNQEIAAQSPSIPSLATPSELAPKITPKTPTEPFQLPPPDRLFNPQNPQTPSDSQMPRHSNSELIVVKKFAVIGSSIFSDRELEKITNPYTNKPISIVELFQVRTKITELYLERGYITSGAYLPEQDLQTGTVKIQIVEGGLDRIKITGLSRLNAGYIQSRIAIATVKPLNRNRLLEALQLLQINPLIESISANLSPSLEAGLNDLEIKVTEAPTFSLPITFDNSRAPSVGSERRQIQMIEANLTGLGDRLSLSYGNTDGSNAFDASYTIPFNPYNGTIGLSLGTSSSNVIESPFNILDIASNSRNYELTIRQPILQNPAQDLALGLTLSHRQSSASLLGGLIPFPALGADDNGQTKVTALRFFQEYVQRSAEEVFAVRSQLSLGLNALGSTINDLSPDSRFLTWRGQTQYLRLLAPQTLLLLRADLQLSDRPLLSQEQISLGGQDNLRGYRQDALLSDNGLVLSAEVRIPILQIPDINGLLQVVPFCDFGTVWNQRANTNPDPSTLVSVGMGLRFQMSDRLTIRLDLGLPLSRISAEKRTLQENGIYFSISANPF